MFIRGDVTSVLLNRIFLYDAAVTSLSKKERNYDDGVDTTHRVYHPMRFVYFMRETANLLIMYRTTRMKVNFYFVCKMNSNLLTQSVLVFV